VTATYIRDATLVRPGSSIARGSLLLRDGRIAAIDPDSAQLPVDCEIIDAVGKLLTPGLIDVHTHGIHGFPYERDAQDMIAGTALLAQYGTTCVLPTLYKILDGDSLDKIERLTAALDDVSGVYIPGFHFEGPFLAIPGAGARTMPGDLGLLDELLSAANGRVSAMSVSPECPNILPIIEQLHSLGIAVFITHTRASVSETRAAIDAGARHATHFYDVFPAPPETEAGVRPVGAVETLLADECCSVDFICDGVHVDPMAIRAALAAKGPRGIIAITDANVGAGLADGVYDTPWGYKVKVSGDDAARVEDESHPLHGLLAGSSLTMNRAIENLQTWLRIPVQDIWAMGTCNPARVVGLSKKGVIEVGADADVVLWDDSGERLTAVRTWVNGTCVYIAESGTKPILETSRHERLISI
jgi:N-acetylglucosamine-6-phosphate deacetylase